MREHIIKLETAKLAKEKGLRYYFEHSYWEDKLTNMTPGFADHDCLTANLKYDNFERYYAPSQSLLQKWLREIHDINVLINYEIIDDSKIAYTWEIKKYIDEGKGRKKDMRDFYESTYSLSLKMKWFDTCEQCLEDGSCEALKYING